MPSISFSNTVLENEITPNGEGHKLEVLFGRGDGFYPNGKQVTVRAMIHEGMEFVKWEVDDSLAIADENSPTTTVTIPGQDSVIRATFNYSEGNVFWTGVGGDRDITNPANWSNKLMYTSVGENFNPEVGFLDRKNYRKYDGTVLRRIRPKDLWGLHEIRPHITYRGYWGFDDFHETGYLHIDNHWEWRNGLEIHTGVNFSLEGVRDPFEIYDLSLIHI